VAKAEHWQTDKVADSCRLRKAAGAVKLVAASTNSSAVIRVLLEPYYSSYINENFDALASNYDLKPVRNVRAFDPVGAEEREPNP
jgi:hypothetical protein